MTAHAPDDTYRDILTRLGVLEEADASTPPRPIPLIDPTANVLKLVEQSIVRLDDLRALDNRRQDELRGAESRRVDEEANLRVFYDEKLRDAESKRIDAIRSVDVAAVATANERATAQASVLANQVAQSAETLRSLVASTAASVATNLANVSSQLADRLTLLERSQYLRGGVEKQQGESREQGNVNRTVLVTAIVASVGFVLTLAALFLK